jgi:hypothetical protein
LPPLSVFGAVVDAAGFALPSAFSFCVGAGAISAFSAPLGNQAPLANFTKNCWPSPSEAARIPNTGAAFAPARRSTSRCSSSFFGTSRALLTGVLKCTVISGF